MNQSITTETIKQSTVINTGEGKYIYFEAGLPSLTMVDEEDASISVYSLLPPLRQWSKLVLVLQVVGVALVRWRAWHARARVNPGGLFVDVV